MLNDVNVEDNQLYMNLYERCIHSLFVQTQFYTLIIHMWLLRLKHMNRQCICVHCAPKRHSVETKNGGYIREPMRLCVHFILFATVVRYSDTHTLVRNKYTDNVRIGLQPTHTYNGQIYIDRTDSSLNITMQGMLLEYFLAGYIIKIHILS